MNGLGSFLSGTLCIIVGIFAIVYAANLGKKYRLQRQIAARMNTIELRELHDQLQAQGFETDPDQPVWTYAYSGVPVVQIDDKDSLGDRPIRVLDSAPAHLQERADRAIRAVSGD